MNKVLVILIFDIGKTNKKLLLLSQQYKILHEENVQLEETVDEDGFPCENIELLSNWVLSRYQHWIHSETYQISAVNFSAYGASFVLLDKDGKPCMPLYNYLKSFPDELHQSFYEQYGGEEKFALETASPVLGNLNAGLQLYRLSRQKPSDFKKIKYVLHLPQYISYLISKKMASDITSIGCHTALWDFTKNQYHDWVATENIAEKLQPIQPSDACTINAASNISVGVGLHDSSAALIPYLKTINEPFVLVSTGTWCISLNPYNEQPLTASELKKDCLFYFSYQGKKVKASRLFAGHEHDIQTKRLTAYFQVDEAFYQSMQFDQHINEKLDSNISGEVNDFNPKHFIFSSRNLQEFSTFREAYHQLIFDLVSMQVRSIQLVIQNTNVKSIYVDGGFSVNDVYMNMLSNRLSAYRVYAATVPHASSMGAAVVMHEYWNDHALPVEVVQYRQIHPL